uniref:C2H2-type domain-containing protein n=1 Tax=Romanomermis culicivorax TaxID=13658 RepID=A0A915L3Y5_ROMCU
MHSLSHSENANSTTYLSSKYCHYCYICNTQLNSCKQALLHCQGKRHKKKLEFLAGQKSSVNSPIIAHGMSSTPSIPTVYTTGAEHLFYDGLQFMKQLNAAAATSPGSGYSTGHTPCPTNFYLNTVLEDMPQMFQAPPPPPPPSHWPHAPFNMMPMMEPIRSVVGGGSYPKAPQSPQYYGVPYTTYSATLTALGKNSPIENWSSYSEGNTSSCLVSRSETSSISSGITAPKRHPTNERKDMEKCLSCEEIITNENSESQHELLTCLAKEYSVLTLKESVDPCATKPASKYSKPKSCSEFVLDSGYLSSSGDESIICLSKTVPGRPLAKFRCQPCNIFLNSKAQVQQHLKSQRHANNNTKEGTLKKLCRTKKPICSKNAAANNRAKQHDMCFDGDSGGHTSTSNDSDDLNDNKFVNNQSKSNDVDNKVIVEFPMLLLSSSASNSVYDQDEFRR